MAENISIRSLEKYDINPFRKELLEEFAPVKKREYVSQDGKNGVQNILVANGTGEVIGESRLFRYKTVDTEQFTKIFTKRVAAIFDMTKPASRVFAYLQNVLPVGKDELYFDIIECKEFTGYTSVTSIWAGVKWLIENEFIARNRKTNFLFINSTIFFNGDRVAFVEVLTKRKKDDSIPENQMNMFEQTKK